MPKLSELAPDDLAVIRKRFGIPEDADLTLLEMERTFPFSMWGWDDEQLEAMQPAALEAQLEQRRTGLVRLEQTVDNERREILKLELLLERCRVLHGG